MGDEKETVDGSSRGGDGGSPGGMLRRRNGRRQRKLRTKGARSVRSGKGRQRKSAGRGGGNGQGAGNSWFGERRERDGGGVKKP